ncbi:MAG TPA: TIM44-like domain-containing protein [Kofleriaceae bacterium]
MSGVTTRLPSRSAARLVAWLLGLVVVGALCSVAVARPGGGQSYSGGGHSYSGGSHSSSGGGGYSGGGYSHSSSSGGGGGSFSPGAAAGLLIGFGIMVLILMLASSGNERTYTTAFTAPSAPPPIDLAPILERDPDFSRVAFEDFVYRLYAAAQRARHNKPELAKLTPYFGPGALSVMERRTTRIEQVVIGNLRIVEASIDQDAASRSKLVVAVEANLAGPAGTTNVSERWTFVRDPGVKTRPPEHTRTLSCPNCNSPFTKGEDTRTCGHCGTTINVGQFDWTVYAINVDAETSVGYTLTGTVEEVGNDFPTLTEPQVQETLMKLRNDDANVTWDAFTARVTMIYSRLNDAWNAQDLTPVRGLVTSSLLQYLQFWIDEYKRQQLANKLEQPKLSYIKLAKVTRDKWYDAITVRVYAEGFDFTIDKNGSTVGGSKDDRRSYTEYWTFLRSSARRGPITTTPSCPNCGAPLAISNTGDCTHCSAQIENASFDWTLSKIEQDDIYRG